MDVPLNLTPSRGPSVWDAPARTTEPWQIATIMSGAALVGYGWPFRSPATRMIAGAGFTALALGLIAEFVDTRTFTTSIKRWAKVERDKDDDLDRTLRESFPASDPPAR